MHFREITIHDYEQLVTFWKENYFVSEMDSKERFQLFLDKNPHLSILAEENDIILGTGLGSFDGRRGYLQKIVVSRTQRKRGVGKQIVEMILQELKELDVLYIPISVETDLVHFYETVGFKRTEQVPMNIELK